MDWQPHVPSGLQQAMSIVERHVISVLQPIRLHGAGPLSSGGLTHIPPEHSRLWLAQS